MTMDEINQVIDHLRDAKNLRLLLVSDSHGRTDGIASLLQQTGQPDLILHLGDHQDPVEDISMEMECPVLGVSGNCDHWPTSGPLPEQRLVVLAGRRFFMTHGHRYHVKSSLSQIVQVAANPPWRAEFILFGHTHHRMIQQRTIEGNPVWLINPGSSFPGHHGPQGIWLEISDQKIRIDPLPSLQKP